MKKCLYCGAQIADDSRFCAECGKEVAQANVCPHCGASINDGDVFCYNCGKSLNESSSEPIDYEEEEQKSGFKKYLPYIIGAFVLLAIIGYFNSEDSNNGDNSTNTVVVDSLLIDSTANPSIKEIITKRLEEIFEDVAKGNAKDCDERYFSSDFKKIYKEVADIDERFVQEGSLGFWDFTFWEMTQGVGIMSVDVKDVFDIKDKEATARLSFKYSFDNAPSEYKNEDIRVILENGNWVLDDLHGYKKRMKDFYEENKDFQPSTIQNDTDWLQGHWVYEQGNYKGHFIIEGDKITQYSSMNPERETFTFRVEGDEIVSRIANGVNLTVKIDFANQRIDYGDGLWMRKVSSSSDNYSSSGSNTSSSSRTFTNEQMVVGYLANKTFRSSDGFTIRFDGSGRMYAEGDYAGVVSVLNYNSMTALLRYGGGQYSEGRFKVDIVGDKLKLTDPIDGTVYYQK